MCHPAALTALGSVSLVFNSVVFLLALVAVAALSQLLLFRGARNVVHQSGIVQQLPNLRKRRAVFWFRMSAKRDHVLKLWRHDRRAVHLIPVRAAKR